MSTEKSQRPALLSPTGVVNALTQLNGDAAMGWRIEAGALQRTFHFNDFHETMAFANAVAYVAHQHDHHPAMSLSYNQCTISWVTHEPPGLTALDFLAAQAVSRLYPIANA